MTVQPGGIRRCPVNVNFWQRQRNTTETGSIAWITYNQRAHTTIRFIRNNLDRSPIVIRGVIEGVGPALLPSTKTKIHRFARQDKHQVFYEPRKGLTTQ